MGAFQAGQFEQDFHWLVKNKEKFIGLPLYSEESYGLQYSNVVKDITINGNYFSIYDESDEVFRVDITLSSIDWKDSESFSFAIPYIGRMYVGQAYSNLRNR